MKLLFDQNLSFRLCALLADLFPGSEQVRSLDLSTASDQAIWEAAKAGNFLLVTQDSDFAEMAALNGHPPKVIWLRCGNQPTKEIERIFRDEHRTVAAFSEDASSACLELY